MFGNISTTPSTNPTPSAFGSEIPFFSLLFLISSFWQVHSEATLLRIPVFLVLQNLPLVLGRFLEGRARLDLQHPHSVSPPPPALRLLLVSLLHLPVHLVVEATFLETSQRLEVLH
jgi:hypothetical protein